MKTPPLNPSKRVPAAVLALIPLTAGLGIHKFYLGHTRAGAIHLLLGLCLLGVVVGFIEGIIYLTMSDDAFRETYIKNNQSWF